MKGIFWRELLILCILIILLRRVFWRDMFYVPFFKITVHIKLYTTHMILQANLQKATNNVDNNCRYRYIHNLF